MGIINPNIPTIGDPNSTEDADVANALSELLALVNGNLDGDNLDATFLASLGSGGGGGGAAASSGARVTRTSNQSISHNAVTAITFDTERWDTDGYHSGSDSRLTAPAGGIYSIRGGVLLGATPVAGAFAYAAIRLNGSITIERTDRWNLQTAENPTLRVGTEWKMNAGDYVELVVYQAQASGSGSMAVAANGAPTDNWSPEFMITRT